MQLVIEEVGDGFYLIEWPLKDFNQLVEGDEIVDSAAGLRLIVKHVKGVKVHKSKLLISAKLEIQTA